MPTKEIEKRQRHDEIHCIREQALHAIGDHDGELATRDDEEKRRPEKNRHDDRERGDRQTGKMNVLRQAAEVDEKAAADRGENSIIQNARPGGEHPGENPKSPAVAHLEKLRQSERAGFAIAVDDEAGEAHDDADGKTEHLPPERGEAGDRAMFECTQDRADTHSRHPGCGADEIAPRDSSRREEVADALHVFMGGVRNKADDDHRHCHDGPVNPAHWRFSGDDVDLPRIFEPRIQKAVRGHGSLQGDLHRSTIKTISYVCNID